MSTKRIQSAEKAIAEYLAMREDARNQSRAGMGSLKRELGVGDSRHRGLGRPLIALSKALPNVLKQVREYNENGAAEYYGLDPLPARGTEQLLAHVVATMAKLAFVRHSPKRGKRGRPASTDERGLENELWDALKMGGASDAEAAKRTLAAFKSKKGPTALLKRQRVRARPRT